MNRFTEILNESKSFTDLESYILPIEDIPQNVKSLYFHGECKILLFELPPHITDIIFHKNFHC